MYYDGAAYHQVAHSCGLLNHLNGFCRGMFNFNAKFDADSLLYLLSHFEWDIHTVHVLTQWQLLPPLSSTVKSSLFTHVHSSSLSLAARLHWCCANHSHYINNGWNFPSQIYIYIFYLYLYVYVHSFIIHMCGSGCGHMYMHCSVKIFRSSGIFLCVWENNFVSHIRSLPLNSLFYIWFWGLKILTIKS